MPADGDGSFEESFADIGARETYLGTAHEDAVERVREAFTDAGFGTPTEFAPSENIREHTGEGTQRVYHLSLPKVLERVGLAPDDPASADAWQGALDVAGSGVEEAFETLNASEIAADAPTPADD